MKKMILVICTVVCCLAAGPALAVYNSGYTASGTVYDKATQTVVPNPSTQLTAVGGGGSASNPGTGYADGSYSAGWASGVSMVGYQMTVKAWKSILAGSTTWNALANVETNKDVSVSLAIMMNPNLGFITKPIHATSPGLQLDPAFGFVYPGGPTISVSGITTTLSYDPSKMMCDGVDPLPPFINLSADITVPGTIMVSAFMPVGSVLLGNVATPTPMFTIRWNVPDVNTAAITVVTVESCELMTSAGSVNPVPNRTENLIGTAHTCNAHLLIDSQTEWTEALSSWHVRPLLESEWTGYMEQCGMYGEGLQYPTNVFKPASLAVYEGGGGGGGGCEDAGLVMMWGGAPPSDPPSGSYSSAWKYDYLLDPDLSNSTITVGVTPKQFGLGGNQVNAVSFGIKDTNGNIRSWWWSCPAPLPWNVTTTITIDTSKVGVGASNPVATGFANNPAFNIKNSQLFIVDENFNWVFGQMQVPPPGQMQLGVMWNYWHNLIVTPNTSTYKGYYVKWSQQPVVDTNGMINGWDELSSYANPPIVADDWECNDPRPVTDIHWWGSFQGWTQPHLPPVMPKAFHIGIWTDVPADGQNPFSHPGTLVWENICDSWVWNFAGFDKDPRHLFENEACFQFNQLLSQDEWFYQEPNGPDGKRVYWLSISAIYNAGEQQYPFGWKTRPHHFNDDAVRIGGVFDPSGMNAWPPVIGSTWSVGGPIEYPAGISWDTAFELTTNEPVYKDNPIPGDLNTDKTVNFKDFAIFAQNWLVTSP